MQSGKHQVSSQRGLNGDFCGFKVTDFTHQNDVRVLPQEGSQRGRKVQPDLLFHLHLVDASQLKFNWVLRRHDVRVRLIQSGNGRVERVGLAGSGWARDQHHAIRFQNRFLKLHQRLSFESQLRHVEPQVFFIEQPQHDLLAPQRGQRADAEIELLLPSADIHLQHDAAVLRQPLLANVELRHDL